MSDQIGKMICFGNESTTDIEEEAKNKNENSSHIQALENLQKLLNNVKNELNKSYDENNKIKLKLSEKEKEILVVNKNLSEKSTCLNSTQQNLKSIQQEKLNLEEEIEALRKDQAEEMEDVVDLVNDLKNKEEELAQLKLLQQVQGTELITVRKEYHKLQKDSEDVLQKNESRSRKDMQAAKIKVRNFIKKS